MNNKQIEEFKKELILIAGEVYVENVGKSVVTDFQDKKIIKNLIKKHFLNHDLFDISVTIKKEKKEAELFKIEKMKNELERKEIEIKIQAFELLKKFLILKQEINKDIVYFDKSNQRRKEIKKIELEQGKILITTEQDLVLELEDEGLSARDFLDFIERGFDE